MKPDTFTNLLTARRLVIAVLDNLTPLRPQWQAAQLAAAEKCIEKIPIMDYHDAAQCGAALRAKLAVHAAAISLKYSAAVMMREDLWVAEAALSAVLGETVNPTAEILTREEQ